MTDPTHSLAVNLAEPKAQRIRSTELGVATYVAAGALAVYSAYGDPHPKADQTSGVPFLLIVGAVVAAVVFGVLVPRALRAISEERAGSARWALTHGIVAMILTPFAFWSGLPVVVGGAGVWLGRRTAEQRQAAGSPTGPATAAIVMGALAIVLSVLAAVLGNTILARS